MTDNLDINTPKGRRTVQDERRAAWIIMNKWPGCKYVNTDKNSIAAVHALLIRDDILKAVAETKCRYECTLNKFQTTFRNHWLVTHDKLIKGEAVAKLLCVEFWGFVYLVADDLVLRIKLFEPKQGRLVAFNPDKTVTQATCNGGQALRENAFIDMAKADVILP